MLNIKKRVLNCLSDYEMTENDYSLHLLIDKLEKKCRILEEENNEIKNDLNELNHFINAVDTRIDIIMEHCKIKTNV